MGGNKVEGPTNGGKGGGGGQNQNNHNNNNNKNNNDDVEWNNGAAGGCGKSNNGNNNSNNEDCDRFSFDDSDRFEEDSLCTWSSEPESLCNNWRGWKRPLLPIPSNGNAVSVKRSSESAHDQVVNLAELSARCVATYIPFELVEHVFPPVPEQLQLRIAFWSFPDNEEDIRLYSCLANSSAEEFHRGETLYKSRSVKHPLQIGFHLSATVVTTQPRSQFNVAVTFDRRKISSCNCTCTSVAFWCSHVVAVCLHRIHCPNEVCLRAPVSESLTRLQRDQLQKFAQYLISELPQQILPTAQRLLDELLSLQPTAINTTCGAPDPTAGASVNDQTNWYLDEKTLHDNIKKILIKFCLPAPMVYSDVNYLTNCAPPAAAEWSSLLRPLRGREPEGMWNLLSIVREMYRRCDRNAIRLLEIITEECMACDQILVWWFNTKLSLLAATGSYGGGGGGGGKHSNTHSNSNASQHACSSLFDEIVVLWRLAALNPGLAPDERDMLHAQFTAWHLKILDRVAKNRVGNSSHSSKQQQNIRTDAELFTGFKAAIEACYLDWEDYPILGVTYTQDLNPMYHCPFTCFKHMDASKPGETITLHSHVNSSQSAVLMNSVKHFNPTMSAHHHHNCIVTGQAARRTAMHRDRFYVSSISSADSMNVFRNGLNCNGGVIKLPQDVINATSSPNTKLTNALAVMETVRRSDDGNRSTASSEGFCDEESNTENATEKVRPRKHTQGHKKEMVQDYSLPSCSKAIPNSPFSTPSSSSTSLDENGASSVTKKEEGIISEMVLVDRMTEIVETTTVEAKPTKRRSSKDQESFSSSESFDNLDFYEFKDEQREDVTLTEETQLPQLLEEEGAEAGAVVDMTAVSDTNSVINSSVVTIKSPEVPQTTNLCEESLNCSNEIANIVPKPSKISPKVNGAGTNEIFSNLKPTEDAWDILFARAEGLHAHGHGKEACTLAVRLAEEMLAHPPDLMVELPLLPKRKGKKSNINPISHQMSVLASATLSKCAFLCTVLAENSEHHHLAFRICLFGLEMPRPPASTKPLEVKLANQETDLLYLLKKIPLDQMELKVIREKAQQLRDCNLKSRGEALLPIMLASYIFDAMAVPIVSTKDSRSKYSYRMPTDENLGFEAAVAALGLKTNVSEAEHPLLCEGTRRQRGELASTLLYHYKDDPRKVAKIMEKLLDREIHVLFKAPLLPAYYSNNPPVRTALQQSRREEQEAAAHLKNDQLQAEYSSNSRPQSSTSAELESCMGAMSLTAQNASSPNGAMINQSISTPTNNTGSNGNSGSISTGTRPKDLRYKGKRAYPSIPNQPSEASAHFMFELAKTVLTKAGGTSSTSLFTQATTSQNHHGPHRALHMCAFQLGLYALGLHNCVSPNWLSRTYSSHVCWIVGQAMEIGAPAISFLIDTWESHLTPPEAAGMADRASRGWDSNMIYPAAELALSVLPHAAALNPNEIQRAILQCKEQSDKMLERACIIVENAAKSGGVYPEVLFQVARYWYELYIRNTPGGEMEHDVNDIHLDHNVNFGQLMDVQSMEQQQQQQQQVSQVQQQQQVIPQPPPTAVVHGASGGQQVVVTTAPPQPYQQGVATIGPMGISPPYGYTFPCPNIYSHHHNINFGHNQIPMYISPQPPQFPYPPPNGSGQHPAGPPQQHGFVQPVGVPPTFQQLAQMPPMPAQNYQPIPCGANGKPYAVPPPQNVMTNGNGGQMPPNAIQYYPNPAVAMPQQNITNIRPAHHSVVYPFVPPTPAPPVRQRHPHQFSSTQLRYLLAAYNVGMLAMETLSRRVHDDRPQSKYARDPPYGEDVKWLLRVSKKLGTQYLHQFCMCAVNSIVSPFVLHDVAIESAYYLARNNPALVLQHLRSALAPLVTKCQQMYIQCIHQKLYHLTTADYEDFSSIILAARTAFQISVDGNTQFKDWLQSIRRSKSCKKDLWTQINAALQNNSK